MSTIQYIGIRGNRIGCGKDTVTQLLIANMASRGIVFEHRKFADPIRDVVCMLTGLNRSFTQTTEGKSVMIDKAGKTVGKLLQDIGSAMKHIMYDEIWVDAAFTDTENKFVVFSDVRFPKELEAIKKRSGIIIEVQRDGFDETALAGRSVLHESETALKGYSSDFTIINNGSMSDLSHCVNELVNLLEK